MRSKTLTALRQKLFLGITALMIVSLAGMSCEALIRLLGTKHPDGNFTFGWRRIRPFHHPTARFRYGMRIMRSKTAMIDYDPRLGWKPKPSFRSEDGMFMHDVDGLRSDSPSSQYAVVKPRDVLRVAVFGDSFVYGSEVPYEDTWCHLVETYMAGEKRVVEVMNFGVIAYGMDQAFLRWVSEGSGYSPDIVLFGFMPGDIKRNLNCLRPYCAYPSVPFSKPRFIMQDDRLVPINSPAIRPDDILQEIPRIEHWDLIRYEHFYNPRDFANHFWLRSRTIGLLCSIKQNNRFHRSEQAFFEYGSEAAEICLAIVKQFSRDAARHDTSYCIVHLPRLDDLKDLQTKKEVRYQRILATIKKTYRVIDPASRMLADRPSGQFKHLFSARGHYSKEGNRIVASVVADALSTQRPFQAQ